MVLYAAAIEFKNYDKAVIVSGDGDFYCLYDYLEKKRKLLSIVISNAKTESSLLRRFQRYKTFIIFEKERLELKENKSGRRRS